MTQIATLLEMATERPKGPAPGFETPHLILAFIIIGDQGLIGRQVLAARSGLGEGSIRTILKKLREAGYADANASGCYLTPEGQKVHRALMSEISGTAIFSGTDLTVGAVQAALAVRSGGKSVKSGIEQRDAAIGIGAKGATTYVLLRNKFSIPGGSSDCEKDYPNKAWASMRSDLKPRNGDALVLCGAADETSAKLGALAAALTLL